MKRRTMISGALVFVMAVGMLSGCSGSGQTASKEQGADVIKLAIASPVTGDSAEYGDL